MEEWRAEGGMEMLKFGRRQFVFGNDVMTGAKSSPLRLGVKFPLTPAGRSQIPDAAGRKRRPRLTSFHACRARQFVPDPAPELNPLYGSCSSGGPRRTPSDRA